MDLTESAVGPFKIDVVEHGWADAEAVHIRAVCNSVAECFLSAIAERPMESIRVEPTKDTEDAVPMTIYERHETGEIRVLLTVRGPRWAQLSYQFAHEFCHVLCNFRPPDVRPCKWIEES